MIKSITLNEEEIKKFALSRWANEDYNNFGFVLNFGYDSGKDFLMLEEDSGNIKLKEITFKYEEIQKNVD